MIDKAEDSSTYSLLSIGFKQPLPEKVKQRLKKLYAKAARDQKNLLAQQKFFTSTFFALSQKQDNNRKSLSLSLCSSVRSAV